jgi:hypothetical protein
VGEIEMDGEGEGERERGEGMECWMNERSIDVQKDIQMKKDRGRER